MTVAEVSGRITRSPVLMDVAWYVPELSVQPATTWGVTSVPPFAIAAYPATS